MIRTVLALVALVALAGCRHEDYATPEERTRLEATDALIAEKQAQADAIEAQILELRADLETAEDIAAAATQFEALMVEYRAANEAIDGAVTEQREITKAIEARTGGGLIDMALPFLPAPVREPVAVLGTTIIGLFFKRTRKHVGSAVKNTAKLNLGEAIADFARALGWKHTTEDPDQLARTAAMLKAKADAKAGSQA
jgi:hypothetical protein